MSTPSFSEHSKHTGRTRQFNKRIKPDAELINISVWGQDGSEVYFRIKKSAKLHKLMAVYYQQKEIHINTLRFLHEGRPVRGWDTVAKAGLEDGDRLDAMSNMDGGGSISKTCK